MTYNPNARNEMAFELPQIRKRIQELEQKRIGEGLTMYENLELQNLVAKLY